MQLYITSYLLRIGHGVLYCSGSNIKKSKGWFTARFLSYCALWKRLKQNRNLFSKRKLHLRGSTSWRKIKAFLEHFLVPATHNQSSALHLLIRKLLFSNSHLLRERNYKPLNVWCCWDEYRGAHMSHFVRASGEGLVVREDTRGEEPVLRLQKSEREKREWGSTPPHQSFSLQRCLVIFIYWDDFARNPVAWLCPPTLWYVAWFLAGCPQRKRGRGVSQRDPHRKKNTAHRVHLETPHTIPYTHTHTQTAHQMMHRENGGVVLGGGDRHWLLLKGQWFVSSTIWRNMAHI